MHVLTIFAAMDLVEVASTVGMATAVFGGVILTLTVLLLVAKKQLIPEGEVTVTVNGERKILVQPGSTLLSTLASEKIFIPSACGGGGTCAMCKCQVDVGGGELLPTEAGHISMREAKENWRLSCQVKVKQDMDIRVPDEVFGVQKFVCEVISNDNVATFIKELKLAIPEGQTIDFEAGGYIQIDVPKYRWSYEDFDIPEEYREDWDKFNLWQFTGYNDEDDVYRAYSMANHPAEGQMVMLNIRIASPPPRMPDVQPGVCSSYVFNLKPGDKVTLSGPYGEFRINETEREMVYIGGGAGMAPLRAQIFHLFHTEKTNRKVSYWYGARSLREMFYWDEFKAIEKDFPNFKMHVALSNALEEDQWDGKTGFIHQVLFDNYLGDHEAPEDLEYYLCGPPMMNAAVLKMLDDLGVPEENIRFDDFGG
jgi:Na+-transporting NADH:ubiquinone oxidoreductase subunit F